MAIFVISQQHETYVDAGCGCCREVQGCDETTYRMALDVDSAVALIADDLRAQTIQWQHFLVRAWDDLALLAQWQAEDSFPKPQAGPGSITDLRQPGSEFEQIMRERVRIRLEELKLEKQRIQNEKEVAARQALQKQASLRRAQQELREREDYERLRIKFAGQ